ncbi:receptor-like protein 14 [Corylus avellana]|uniref:receptor-like protein 14 n=1 Tax=Corylus avellana TaxID=13451 RepID=UPI00286D6197|nr:receptor-like protein 14 [Corylus avellana]
MKNCFAENVFLLWVTAIAFSPLACGDGCSKEQTRALLEMRNSTNGFAFAGWDGRDCCEAGEINCRGTNGGVSSIHLGGYGRAPPSSTWYPNVTLFTLFDELKALSLVNMQIGGGLQPFCQLKRSKHLWMLDLDYNRLEGIIPSCLGMIENIEVLDLSDNLFHGNLPQSIFSKKSKIMFLYASSNQLEGVISFSIFANASRLMNLDLSSNKDLEIETESPSWVPTFQLSYLNLANCSLNKKNGHVFPSFISTQVFLLRLDLSHNLIEGSVPCELLFNRSIRVLSLRSNQIDGSLSFGCFANQTSSLIAFDISENNVTGSLPENIGHLLPDLYYVDMSSNALEGIIPSSFGNLSFEILDLSNNKLSGTIPRGLTRDGTPLVYLNLSNNKLKGEILPRDSNMTKLKSLQLNGNQFEGMISPTISNSPNLVILDIGNNHLSGNIPKWLYDHPRLVAVLLSGNRFEGHLLRRMCGMQSLQVFDISNNHISGGIPSCLDNITFWKKSSPNSTDSNYYTVQNPLYDDIEYPNGQDKKLQIQMSLRIKYEVYTFQGIPLSLMSLIDMSSNQLIGSIPSEMGELLQLRSLNLSNNFLTGPIPNSFRNLKNMENLDLSHNKLTGGIPYELVGLTSLSTFSVASNNLSGRIPFERQFSTFGTQSYDDNPDLCGVPLPKNCSTTNKLEPEHEDEREETRIIDSPLFFYAFVAVSYAFGFWVFFGILIIKKNWRQIYFRAVDKYIESCFEMLSKYW